MTIKKPVGPLLFLCLLVFSQQVPAPPPNPPSGYCRSKTKVTNNAPLQFGWMAVAGPGTVTISTDGIRTSTGGVVPLPGGTISAAGFDVSGCPDATYTIVLPSSITLSSGTNTMVVDGFVSSPEGSGLLDGSGFATLKVGGTLNPGAGQAAGDYSGNFLIEIIY